MRDKPFAVLTRTRGGTEGLWTVDLSGQNASITATDLVAAANVSGGIYVIKGVARVTTAAGTSSSLNVQLKYTDNDGGTLITTNNIQGLNMLSAITPGIVVTPNNSTGTGGIFYFSQIISASAGNAIQYLASYASNPASAMVYSLHIVASRF